MPAGRPPAVLPRRARRDLLLVDRRPVPLARPAALGDRCCTRPTTSSPASACSPWPAPARSPSSLFGRTAPWLGAALGSVALAAGHGADRARGLDRVDRAVLDRRHDRRRRLRRRLPRRPARAVRRRSRRAPRRGHVGVLHRRLRGDLGARRSSPACSSRRSGCESTFEIFGSIVAALALVVAFEAYRTRPRRATHRVARHSASSTERRGGSWSAP